MNMDGGFGRRVFEGVGNEIVEDLKGGAAIGFRPETGAGADLDPDFLARGRRAVVFDAFFDEFPQIETLYFRSKAAFLDGIGIEQIGNEVAPPRAGADDHP